MTTDFHSIKHLCGPGAKLERVATPTVGVEELKGSLDFHAEGRHFKGTVKGTVTTWEVHEDAIDVAHSLMNFVDDHYDAEIMEERYDHEVIEDGAINMETGEKAPWYETIPYFEFKTKGKDGPRYYSVTVGELAYDPKQDARAYAIAVAYGHNRPYEE